MARKASTFSLSNIIASKRADIASARAKLQSLQDNADCFRAAIHVVNMVADLAKEHDFTRWSYISATVWSDGPEVDASIEGSLTSLKEGAIVEIIERAMACGFEAVGSNDVLTDWASRRNFKFEQTVAGVKVKLTLTANIEEGATACRKVRVGTKLEEVAQYEIVCE